MCKWVLLFIFLSQYVSGEPLTVSLSPGEQKNIPLAKMGPLTITNPRAAKIEIIKGGLKITARRQGVTHVFSSRGKEEVEITVHNAKLNGARQSLARWLTAIHGIKLRIRPDSLILEGKAFRLNDWRQIQKFKKQFSPYVKSQVVLSDDLSHVLRKAVRDSLRQRSLSSTWIDDQNGITIRSSLNSKEKRAAKEVAEEWGLDEPQVTASVELKPMVEVDVVIAEVKKNSMRSLGLQLPGSYSATILPAGDLSSAALNFSPLEASLHAGHSNGAGRVLANPKLLCRSGETARFIAGGEIPIKIITPRLHDIVWKSYGVILNITPLADQQNRISTKLTTEVSLLDDSRVINGIPGLFTNRIETHFDLEGAKTIALSGLIKSELGKNTNSNSLLGEIPILGELFKSRDYKDSRTELVVFVTPRVRFPQENPPVPQLPQWKEEDF